MSTKFFNTATFAALFLFTLVLLCSLVIYALYHKNSEIIKANKTQEKNRVINTMLLEAGVQMLDQKPLSACDVCYQLLDKQSKKKFFLLSGSAQGYVAQVKLLLLLDESGSIKALSVLHNQDTLGIGDRIGSGKSGWLSTFRAKNIKNRQWDIVDYAGDFDQISGATITSRAALRAIGEIKQVFGGVKID